MSEENIPNEAMNAEPTPQVESVEPVETIDPGGVDPAFDNDVNFGDLLSDDVKALSNVKDFQTADDLAKSYVELQRMVGNSVRIPSEDASDEVKSEFLEKIKDVEGLMLKNDEDFYKKLGRPDSPEEYNFSELMSEDALNNPNTFDKEMEDFRSIAHENNLTSAQAQALVEMRRKTVESEQIERQEYQSHSQETLKKLWGSDYQNRLEGAAKVRDIYRAKYGDDMDKLIKGSAGDNPVLLSIMSDLAVLYTEKGHSGMSGAKFGLTAEGAQQKIYEKKADAGFTAILNDDMHPQHKAAVKELTHLYQVANGAA